MDVRTPGSATLSPRTVARYAVAAGTLSACLVYPALVLPAYGRALATLLALLVLGAAARVVVSAAVALGRREPPERDGDLPTVSVLITAYNEAAVLPETIEACRNLDYPAEKLEILVCYETASVDETAEIAEAAAASHARVRAVERDEPPGGKAAVTNCALRHATGEILAVVDADQRFEPDAVRRAVAWFRSDDVWCVKGRCYGTNPRDSLVALHATVERHLAERTEFVARDVLGGFALFTGGQAFFRAAAFDELGPFDETVLLEDLDMTARIHASGKRLRVDPGVVTVEENPTTLVAWWSQRKRWARGGMQVARRHLARLPRNACVPLLARLDALATFGSLLALPLAVLSSPVVLIGRVDATLLPAEGALFGLVALAPVVVPYLVFGRDAVDGRGHDRREYLAPLTLWPYFAVQAAVVVAAFLDEFVFERPAVYVTSTRAESEE